MNMIRKCMPLLSSISLGHSAVLELEDVWKELGHAQAIPADNLSLPGVTISVDSAGNYNSLLVLDTSQRLPRDPDLHVHAGWGVGVSENGKSGAQADDEARGGTIDFVFDRPARFMTFRPVDVEKVRREPGLRVQLRTVSDRRIFLDYATQDGEAGALQAFAFDDDPLVSARFVFLGSGAVTDLTKIAVIPETSSVWVVALLGGVLWTRRRTDAFPAEHTPHPWTA